MISFDEKTGVRITMEHLNLGSQRRTTKPDEMHKQGNHRFTLTAKLSLYTEIFLTIS